MFTSKEKPDLSIVIPNYNTRDLIIQCINSIKKYNDDLNTEIIVIDDCSTDDSVSAIEEEFSDIIIIQNTSNKGYCFSNNKGIEKATSHYIIIMNSDVVLIKNIFKEMIDFMENNNDAGIAGIKQLNKDGSLQYSCRTFPSLFFSFLYSFFPRSLVKYTKSYKEYFLLDMDYNKNSIVDMGSATCCIIRRSVINTIGMMDERYFMYMGDVDWFYRVKQAGFNFYYLASPSVIHLGSQSAILTNRFLIKEYHRGMEIFYKDHIWKNNNLLINILVIFGIRLRNLIILFKTYLTSDKTFTSINIKK